MRSVQPDGRENRQQLAVEIIFNPGVLLFGPCAAAVKRNILAVQFRHQHIVEQCVLLADKLLRFLADARDGFGRRQTRIQRLIRLFALLALQIRHAHFKKFVQIGRYDAQETQPFQQGNARILRLCQYAAVERQQAAFAAKDAVGLGHGKLSVNQYGRDENYSVNARANLCCCQAICVLARPFAANEKAACTLLRPMAGSAGCFWHNAYSRYVWHCAYLAMVGKRRKAACTSIPPNAGCF